MANYFTLCDDMEQLKAQMNILMSHLKQNEIITDEMIRASVQKRMKQIVPSRVKEYIALLIVAGFMPIYLICCYYFGKITSLPFVIATIVLCLYTTIRSIIGKYNNVRNVCKNGNLTEVATEVVRMRKLNIINGIITPLLLIAWCCVYFHEYFKDLVVEHNGLFFAVMIILIVTVDIAIGLYRVHRVTGEVLEEIESIKKEN